MDDLGHNIRRIERTLKELNGKLDTLLTRSSEMSKELDDLTAAVKKTSDTEDSAILLIQGIAKQLADAIAANNPAALKALSDELSAKADALGAAVVANTPPGPSTA